MENEQSKLKKANWKNILIGVAIGAVVVGLGVLIWFFLQPNTNLTTTHPSEESPFKLCDLNKDKDCDEADKQIFNNAFGKCRVDSGYNPEADVNADGCVNAQDQHILFPDDETAKETTNATPCDSTLTDADKLVIQTWKTFTNSKYKYSLKYPESLVIKENRDDSVIFLDESDQSTLQFESGVTGGSTDGLKKTYEKEIEIACEKATVKYYSAIAATPGNDRYILSEFSKNGIPHILTTTYKFIGASLSSSYGQQYDIILKTIEFK